MAKVTDIQDKNGVSKEIQDKDLANRTAQSTVASSDYVLLEDTSGAYHKIAKASFTEAVRGALGSVINSVAKGTDIAKIPVLDSSNDLGMGTLANVASVLGGIRPSGNLTVDANTLTDNGCWSIANLSQSDYHVPYSYGVLTHIETGGYYKSLQIFKTHGSYQRLWMRSKGNDNAWQEWVSLVTTIDEERSDNFDTLVNTGTYFINGANISNSPVIGNNRGFLIVDSYNVGGSYYRRQLYHETVNNKNELWARTYDGEWGAWKKVTYVS